MTREARPERSVIRDAEIFKKNVVCIVSAWISRRLKGSQHEGT